MKTKTISALITAAGSGSRMKSDTPKLELPLKGDGTVLDLTLEKFLDLDIISEIILVTSQELLEKYKEKYKDQDRIKVHLGGASREESTKLGLDQLAENSHIVVCHDGARPLVSQETILASIKSAQDLGSGVAAVPTIDTIKIRKDNKVLRGLDRTGLVNIQTPQAFQSQLIKKAYEKYYKKIQATDDSEFIRALGEDIYLVEASYDNFKITTKRDYLLARLMMEEV